MKTRTCNQRRGESGSILVMTVVFCVLVGIVLVAYLSMVRSQYRFTHRAQTWNSCIPLCEAGLEEAMAHINHLKTTSNFAVNGWVLTSGAYRKERTLNGGTVRMEVDTAMPPTITVNGFLRAPVQTNFLTRTIRVRTRMNYRFPYAVLSRGNVSVSGSTYVDSYDSTDPLQSTLGQYDPLKRDDEATVATTSTASGAISVGNADIYGQVATGPGGDVSISGGSVGSTTWVASNSGIESGHYTDDVNVYIADALLPQPFAPVAPTANMNVGGTNYAYVLGNGDYFLNSVNLSSSGILVQGKARIHIGGTTTMSSSSYILLAPGASVEWYAGGDINVSGQGWINVNGYAKNFNVYGLNTCSKIEYSGTSQFIGTIYAPRADIKMTGTADAFGAVVGKSVTLGGNVAFHYDEALRGDPTEGRFMAASWQEL